MKSPTTSSPYAETFAAVTVQYHASENARAGRLTRVLDVPFRPQQPSPAEMALGGSWPPAGSPVVAAFGQILVAAHTDNSPRASFRLISRIEIRTKIRAESLVPELSAGGHADLSEDVPEVPLDGARTQEEAAADLSIGEPLLGEFGDHRLLTGELYGRSVDDCAFPSPRRSCQFAASALGKARDTHLGQRMVCGGKLIASATFQTSLTQIGSGSRNRRFAAPAVLEALDEYARGIARRT